MRFKVVCNVWSCFVEDDFWLLDLVGFLVNGEG